VVRFVAALLAVVVLAACGTERNMDNPDPIGPGSLETSTTSSTTTLPTITAFVPSTAPTTLAPVTAPPTNATYAPTTAPPAPPTPLPTSATLPPVATIPQRYTVVAGDTLSGIARKLGVTLDALLSANGFTASSLIRPGDQLAIPAGGTPATNPPATNAPATNPPATNAPATNPPATNAPATNPPATNAPATNPPATNAPVPTTTFTPPADALAPASVTASCQAPNSTEANGTPISFSPQNVLDHNPATAWRCETGSSQTLTFTFPSPVHLTSVGLIGGYVKVDSLTGVDRFEQNARVRQVQWGFSDGTNSSTVTQNLADARSMQTTAVDVVATTVTMTVTATYPPGGPAPRDMVPVAEVQFTGSTS